MNLVPSNPPNTIVQQTEFEPADPKDTRTAWQAFVDAIRQSVGLKPLYLAERWAVARVRNEEIEADGKLLDARAKYELAAATAKQIALQAEGQYAKDIAIAKLIESKTRNTPDPNSVIELLEARETSVDDALANLESIAQQIRMLGGSVEIRITGQSEETSG
jgi:hypothetical protein